MVVIMITRVSHEHVDCDSGSFGTVMFNTAMTYARATQVNRKK